MSRSQQVALHGKDNRIGGVDPVPPGRWQYVSDDDPLLNGWLEAGGGLQRFRWRRTNENQTEIQGFVHSGTGNPVINLPDPYRPAETQHAVGSNTDLSLIIWELTPAGNLNVYETVPGAPSGAAGGALDGTYPNPGIAASVAGSGLAESANVLSVNVDGTTLEINADALRIKASGVTANEIAADAVGSSELADNAVDTNALANDAVTGAKIAAGAVDSSELASTAVTPGSYGDSTHIPTFTVDADGRLTAASSATFSAGIGEILISDTPSTPLVFADLIQNEAQDDLVYADP